MLLWKTKDRRELNPEDMSTQHIKNCIDLLKRKGFVSAKTVAFYISCTPPSGDMAMDCFDRECEYVFDAPISKFLGVFEDILEKRKNVEDNL